MADHTPDKPLAGIVLIVAAMAILSAMDAAVKVLVDGGLAILQMLALRSWIVVPFMAAWAVWRGRGIGALKTARPGLHLLRVVAGTGAPLFFFSALKTLPLAEATTIFFGTTFIMTGLSVPILKEKVGPHRWAAVAAGFVGVVIAMRPTGAVFDVGALYVLGGSVSYALFVLITRKLGPGEGTVKQVLYFHAWLGIVSTAALPFVHRAMTPTEIGLTALVAALVVAGHLAMTRAFLLAPIGVIAPFEYSALVWAGLLGFAVWGDVPGTHTLLGGAVIVASGLYVIRREQKLKKAAASPLPSPAPSVSEDGTSSARRR